MKLKLNWLYSFILVVLHCIPSFGQDSLSTYLAAKDEMFVAHEYKPLTLKLTEDGSKYIRFLV